MADKLQKPADPSAERESTEPVGTETRSALAGVLEAEPEKTGRLTLRQVAEFISALEGRFAKTPEHYKPQEGIDFSAVRSALMARPDLLYSLAQMESTGGMPDIIAVEEDAFIFGDCSAESPDRRNLTYDEAAEMAKELGIEMMSERMYWKMQSTGLFDQRTWSWLATSAEIRKAGRALCGRRIISTQVRREDAMTHVQHGGWRGMLRVPKV